MKTWFKWLIILSGIYDLLIGAGLVTTTAINGENQPATWVLSMMSGGFLLFAGAVLVWAAQDIALRGSAILWQGMLRLFAVGVLFYAIRQGYLAQEIILSSMVAAIIDAVAAAIYATALFVIWKLPPWRLLLGRSQ